MTTTTTGRWLLVALAIVGLAVAASAVSAHGTGPTATDASPYNATADWTDDDVTAAEWATWMEAHMTAHVGPDAVEWMETRMGVSLEEMAREMAQHGVAGPGTASGYGTHGPGAGYGPQAPGAGYGPQGPTSGDSPHDRGYGYGPRGQDVGSHGHGFGHGPGRGC